jgi:hypothetical protein
LDRWFKQLKTERCNWDVYRKNWQTSESDLPASKITTEPLGIVFWESAEEVSPLAQANWPQGDLEQLMRPLMDRVKRVIEIVNRLV